MAVASGNSMYIWDIINQMYMSTHSRISNLGRNIGYLQARKLLCNDLQINDPFRVRIIPIWYPGWDIGDCYATESTNTGHFLVT